MAEERTAGVGLEVPDGAKVANCRDCGELVFAIKMTDGVEVLCQPVVIRGLIPDREMVQLANPPPPEELIQKLVSRTATARFSPPIMVPHNLVCIRAPLVRTLPVPTKLVAQGPMPKPPEGDPKVPPPGHKPVTHDLEIQDSKIGVSSKKIGVHDDTKPGDEN